MVNKVRVRMVAAFVAIAVWSNPVFAVVATQTDKQAWNAQAIGQAYLSAFPMDQAPAPLDPVAAAQAQQKIDVEIKPLSDREALERVFALRSLVKSESFDVVQGMDVVAPDLNMLVGAQGNSGASLTNTLNNTLLPWGKLELAIAFATPFASVAKIQHRQAGLKLLVQDQVLFDRVNKSLVAVSEATPAIFSIWRNNNLMTSQVITGFYWKAVDPFVGGPNRVTGYLDRNATLLGFGSRLGEATTVGACVGMAFLSKWFYDTANATTLEQKNVAKKYDDRIAQYEQTNNYYTSVVLRQEKALTLAEMQGFVDSRMLGAKWLGGYTVFITALQVWFTNLRRQVRNYMHTQIIGFAEMVRAAEEIVAIADENPAFANSLQQLSVLRAILDGSSNKSDDFKTLIELLKTSTFEGEASYFSSAGRILKAYTLLLTTKDEFADMMAALGEVDALLSMAKLYKKHAGGRVQYTFVEFIESDKAYLKLEGFWNPMINPAVVVVNSITLGGDHARDGIVTGSNTGGKSTILKGIMINVVLAQAYGIAPASTMIMTPFALLGSSLNIVDNIAGGESLFQAEVNRAHSLIHAADSLEAGAFGFMIIDELFRGTSPDQAGKLTRECVQRLVGYDALRFIVSSHFIDSVTPLEAEMNGVIKNYKVDVIEDGNGGIASRPFKLESGITTNKVANAIFNATFSAHASGLRR